MRIIPTAEVVQLIRFAPSNPPNSRSILRLQKIGSDADCRAVVRADAYAVHFAVIRAE